MQCPKLVDRAAVLNCPHPTAMRKLLYSNPRQMLKSWYMFFFQMPWFPELFFAAHDYGLFDEMFGDQRKPEQWLSRLPFTRPELDSYKYTFSQPGALTAPINYYRAAFLRRAQSVREEGSNNRVKCPTLIIWGTADLALSTSLADASSKYCDSVEVEYMEGASHFVHEDVPQAVTQSLLSFLTQ